MRTSKLLHLLAKYQTEYERKKYGRTTCKSFDAEFLEKETERTACIFDVKYAQCASKKHTKE